MIITRNCCICEASELMQPVYDKFKRKHNQGQGETPSATDRWRFLVAPSKRSDSLILDTDFIDAAEQYPGTVDLESLDQISIAVGVNATNAIGITVDLAAKKVATSHGVKVTAGVGVVTITADDPLKSCYEVLYPECKKRGLPFTLAMPSMVSFIAPAGSEDNDAIAWDRATDAQIMEMLADGATYYYHSNSHTQWRSNNLGWFKNEAIYGAYKGDYLPPIDPDSLMYDETNRAGLTPGDRVAAQLALSATWSGAGALEIRPQGFMPNGQWFEMGEIEALDIDSAEMTALRERWGDSIMIHGGKKITQIPQPQQVIRLGINDNSLVRNKAYIDEAIATGGAVHFFSHEFLADGDAYNTAGAGSAKDETYYPYNGTTSAGQINQSVTYANLTGLLDYIQTKVKAGTLVCLGCGAAMVAQPGTPVNLAGNGDMSKANGDGNQVGSSIPIPSGWSTKISSGHGLVAGDTFTFTGLANYTGTYTVHEDTTFDKVVFTATYAAETIDAADTLTSGGVVRALKDSQSVVDEGDGLCSVLTEPVSFGCVNTIAYTNDRPYISVLRTAGQVFNHDGWYTIFNKTNKCETFLLRGKYRTRSGLNKPRVEIYAGTMAATQTVNGVPENIYSPQPITSYAKPIGGLFNHKIKQVDFDGTTYESGALIEVALNDSQSVVDVGGGLCSVASTAHGLVAGDLFRFQGLANYTGIYTVHATTSANTIVFTATYAAETIDNADYIVKMSWKYFVIPFCLPTPIKRCAVVLSINGEAGTYTGQVEYADIEIIEAGVR